MRNSDNVSFA